MCKENESLEEQLAEAKQREQKLVADMKKRGDAARQMMMEKDSQIQQLKQSKSSSALAGEDSKLIDAAPASIPSSPAPVNLQSHQSSSSLNNSAKQSSGNLRRQMSNQSIAVSAVNSNL